MGANAADVTAEKAGGSAQPVGAGSSPAPSQGITASSLTLGDWLGALQEEERAEVQGLFDAETQGLKSALKAEREARGSLEKRVKDLGRELESAAPAAAAQLEALGAELAQVRRRAAFYEGAPADLWSARLGWLAAQEIGAFDDQGQVKWDILRAGFPELFGAEGYNLPLGALPAGALRGAAGAAGGAAAGAGTGREALPGDLDMSAVIRKAAGRRR